MKKNNLEVKRILSLTLFFWLFFPFFLSFAAIFETDLKVGSNNLEVKILQLLLNLDPETRVSTFGYGALGRETTYFGEKTRLALINFQKKHRVYGEFGQVGPKTKIKLNAILTKILNPKSQIATTTINFVTNTTNVGSNSTIATNGVVSIVQKPVISSISPTSGGDNTEITIKGKNFSAKNNEIVTTYTDGIFVDSSDGETLKFNFVFPPEVFTDDEEGLYYPGDLKLPVGIWVVNSNGRSNQINYDLTI